MNFQNYTITLSYGLSAVSAQGGGEVGPGGGSQPGGPGEFIAAILGLSSLQLAGMVTESHLYVCGHP